MTITDTMPWHPHATVASPRSAALPARPMRPTRTDVLAALATELSAIGETPGIRAAWQGADGAYAAWATATGPADLDIWCDDSAFAVLDALLVSFDAARIQSADEPGRLRHVSYAVETRTGLAVVDLTVGDLMVGPVVLVPATDVRTIGASRSSGGPRLAGVAGAADRFVRPLLRGRLVDGDRLAQARVEWRRANAKQRDAFHGRMRAQLGRRVAGGIVQVLDGADAPTTLVRDARRALIRQSARPANLAATWRRRHTVVPAGRRAGVLGLRITGCLVVLVGTDGSGKSSVAAEVDTRLTAAGLRTTTAYLGMARGNLPGVGLARKLLGVAPAGDQAAAPTPASRPAAPTPQSRDHALLRRAAAWYYAAEYGYRWWRDIRPGLRHGGVVISDRYVYDLRESPWPGSAASRFAEWFMPRPDVLVLPDAPDRIIHARKPERPAAEQEAQQERFRTLVASNPARTTSIVVDTSGLPFGSPDPVAPVVAAVVSTLHRLH